MDLKQYVRVGEVAALLGVTDQTVRNWHRMGKLAGLRHPVNGYHLFRRTDVEALLKTARLAYQDSGGRLPSGAESVEASNGKRMGRVATGRRKPAKRSRQHGKK
jgi:excisionase family DNA binding protein